MPPFMEDVVWQVAHAEDGQDDDGMVAWDPASSLLAVADGRRLFLLDAHAPHERAELRMPRGDGGNDDDDDDNDPNIAALEWSPVGTPRTLLVATRGGMVAVWSQRRRRGGLVLGARGGGGGQLAPMPQQQQQPPAPLLGNGGPPLLPRDSSLGPPPSPPLAALLNAAAPSPPAAPGGVGSKAAAAPSPPTQQQQQPPPLLARATPPSERGPPPPIVAAQPTLALDASAWTCTIVVAPGEEDGGGGGERQPQRRRRRLVHASWLVPQSRHAPLDAVAFQRLAQAENEGASLSRDQVFCRAAPAVANADGANKAPLPLPWVREGTLALAVLVEEEEEEVLPAAQADQTAPPLAHLTLRVCKVQLAPGRAPAWRCSPRTRVCERPLVASPKAGARPASSGPAAAAAHQGRRPNAQFVAAARYWDGGGDGAPAVAAAASSTAAAGCVLVAVGIRCDEGDDGGGAAADFSSSGAVVALYATPPGDPLDLDSARPTPASPPSSPWPLGEVSVGGVGGGGGGGLLALAWDPHAAVASSASYDARLAFLVRDGPSSGGGVRAGVLLVSSLRGLPRGVRMQPPAAANDASLIIPLPPASGALGVPSFGLSWSPAVRAPAATPGPGGVLAQRGVLGGVLAWPGDGVADACCGSFRGGWG